MLLIAFLVLSVAVNVAAVYLLVKASKRLLMFDSLWENICDDLDEGVDFFTYVLSRPVFTNSPEINVMMRNIKFLRDRMVMHVDNLQKKERKQVTPKNHNPPVVVD
jgi:hypothetical protein